MSQDEFMNLPVKTSISVERIEDMLCGAFEGGSNYWARLIVEGDDVKKEDAYFGWLEQGILKVEDPEDEKTYPLDIESIKKGLKVMAEKFTRHFNDFVNENDDAETADVFLQCCVFGDVIYG